MMMLRRNLAASLLAGSALLAASDTGAQAPTLRAPSDCGSAGRQADEVASIIDGRSFRLADGREVRLAGIETPAVAPGFKAAQAGVAGLSVQV